MKKYFALALMSILSMAGFYAHATPIFNANGLAAPVSTITFDEHLLTTGVSVTNQFSDLGVTFTPELYYSSQSNFPPNITGNTVANFGTGYPRPEQFSFSINYLVDQTESAFAMVSNGTTWDFSALLNGTLIEQFSQIVNTSVPNFYGFTGILFDEIRISTAVNDFMIIDNIQMGTANVPEPATLALLGLGLVGIGFARRKKTS